uniref:Uncharacterized protein n=1 Tax=Leersia perrieri TaxID=77586 RepID=A0A0D9VFK2_9ORYZ
MEKPTDPQPTGDKAKEITPTVVLGDICTHVVAVKEPSSSSSGSSNQDWKERFIKLQAFLRSNEQSGQEEYIRMLRSLSSVGRSKHAIELENRAVKLLIEEGKELQKMKVLNVLNKLSPADALPLPTQPASVRHLAFPPR